MTDLVKKFESIIEDTANGLHDSQSWWDDEYANNNGELVITELCRILEKAANKHFAKKIQDLEARISELENPAVGHYESL